jgi:rhodanese-related sulfurtransferase
MFSSSPKVDYENLIKQGAIIVDVRTKAEYEGGHLKNSINIPLNQLNMNLSKINKNKTVITCCASGSRSAMAKRVLINNGYNEVHNAGAWNNLKKYAK